MSVPICICLVGAGRAGRVHANSLLRHVRGGRLVALVEPNAETRLNALAAFGLDAGYASLEEALDSGGFDAVVITTPTFMHRELAVQAAEAGKHVLVEKPMALSLQECDEMIAAARRSGVLLQVGFMRRFDPEFALAWERIQAGEIGAPIQIKSLTHGPGLPPPWARDLHTSNGLLAEVNSHDWDTVRWLMGCNPTRVFAEVGNLKQGVHGIQDPDFYDVALAAIRFENGGIGSISGICPCDYGYDARVEVVGDKGIMQIGEMQGKAVVVCTDRDRGLVTPIYRTWPERFAWAYIAEMEHFVQCVATSEAPRVSGEDGRWAVACVLAATCSYQQDRPVFLTEVMHASGALP